LDVNREVSELAADIRARFRYRTPDAIHLATAQLAGADAFVTNDEALQSFTGVRVVTLGTMLAG
jgi:predicted nucleic acid-binding protein